MARSLQSFQRAGVNVSIDSQTVENEACGKEGGWSGREGALKRKRINTDKRSTK